MTTRRSTDLDARFETARPKRRRPRTEREALPVRLEHVSIKLGGFGGVLLADFSVMNDRFDPVHDVVATCECDGASGMHLSTVSQTIYQSFGPKSTTEFRDVNMGRANPQTAGVACSVTGFAR